MRSALLLTVAVLLAAIPRPAGAQAGSCQLIENVYSERRMEGEFSVVFIQGPLLVRCSGGAEIRSEIATLYEASREIHLSGNVSFRDPDRRLTSHQATYSSVTGRLYATGDVSFTDVTEGMTLRGPELEYFRAMEGRPQSQAIAGQRPHLVLHPRARPGETSPAEAEPIEVDGDRMTMIGNEQYSAVGRVEIRRSDFQAYSREARLDQLTERMELRGNARIHGEQFDLTGDAIDVAMPGDRLEEVLAQRGAELVGEDLRIDAPEVRLYFADDLVQRTVARVGTATDSRAIATARAFRLEADSIDALVPDQLLERVIAIGGARGESLDTTNVPAGRLQRSAASTNLTSGDRDWILGDTITGYFVVADASDRDTEARRGEDEPREQMELNRLVAVGSARSLYRMENSRDGQPRSRPGLNYLVGWTIELSFRNGELEIAEVKGLQHGLYLEPEDAGDPQEGAPLPESSEPVASASRPFADGR